MIKLLPWLQIPGIDLGSKTTTDNRTATWVISATDAHLINSLTILMQTICSAADKTLVH